MKINGVEIWQPGMIIGTKWDRSSSNPQLVHVDLDGREYHLSQQFFDSHPIWGSMRRCTMDTSGNVTYGSNGRGDGLTLDGSTGRVMVEIPRFYTKVTHPSANVWNWWISPVEYPGFEIYPAFVQSHNAGLKGTVHDFLYVGAYEAVLANDAFPAHTGTKTTFHSYTGQQPWTGYDTVRSDGMTALSFAGGGAIAGVAWSIGEAVTAAGSGASGTIVDWIETNADWAGGNAAGTVWLKQQNANDFAAEAVTTATSDATAGGAQTNLTLDMSDCRTYSETNIGGQWGFMNVWSLAAYQTLYIVEYANFYSQSTTYGIGQGIVNKAGGTGFAGEETGYDSADTNIGTNGTGVGSGVDGVTPIIYRGIENPWGNTWAYTDGYNAINASYNIVKADGSGTFADTLTAGNYDASSMAPTTQDGDVTKVEFDDLMKFFLISDGTLGGSSSTYLTDHFYAHDLGETNILLAGGSWANGARAGVASLTSYYVASYSNRTVGSRLEFV
jgi:hypothetical protein